MWRTTFIVVCGSVLSPLGVRASGVWGSILINVVVVVAAAAAAVETAAEASVVRGSTKPIKL